MKWPKLTWKSPHIVEKSVPLLWKSWIRKSPLKPLAWRWCTFRFTGRSQTLVSLSKWHVRAVISNSTTCIAPCVHNVARLWYRHKAIDQRPDTSRQKVEGNRKAETSKFGKVAFNCIISSPCEEPPELTAALRRLFPSFTIACVWSGFVVCL